MGQISTLKGLRSSRFWRWPFVRTKDKAKGRKRASLLRKPLQNAGSDSTLNKLQGEEKVFKELRTSTAILNKVMTNTIMTTTRQ